MQPTKVIDYGHKTAAVNETNVKPEENSSYRPVKIINYGHASKGQPKIATKPPQKPLVQGQKGQQQKTQGQVQKAGQVQKPGQVQKLGQVQAQAGKPQTTVPNTTTTQVQGQSQVGKLQTTAPNKASGPTQMQLNQANTKLSASQRRRLNKRLKKRQQEEEQQTQQQPQPQQQQQQQPQVHQQKQQQSQQQQTENQQPQQQQQQNEAEQPTTADTKNAEQINPKNQTENTETCDLDMISDNEDIPEDPVDESPDAPPPPMLTTSGYFIPDASHTNASIFPSTAEANENIPQMSATHVQMSIPCEENNNTILIDELLLNPGRNSRPKKICVILRGPPCSGKSHVAKLIKDKEKEMGGKHLRVLSIDDYFLVENDYEEKCPKTGKKIPKKEILYEYDQAMEATYLQYLIKQFKKTINDNLYEFLIIDCNNNSLRSLNEFYCHAKDSGYVPYIIDLFCDLETCLDRNIHERTKEDIQKIIKTWAATPFHYIKLDVSNLLENVVEMEDAENVAVDDIKINENTTDSNMSLQRSENSQDCMENDAETQEGNEANNDDDEAAAGNDDDSNDTSDNCGFLKSKWETENTIENLARLDGTSKLSIKRKTTMEEYLQSDEWEPRKNVKGKKRVRWADIEEKRKQEKMRAVGFVVGQTDWKRMMDPNAANRALNKTKYIERVNKNNSNNNNNNNKRRF